MKGGMPKVDFLILRLNFLKMRDNLWKNVLF